MKTTIFFILVESLGIIYFSYRIYKKKKNPVYNGFLACLFLLLFIKSLAPLLSEVTTKFLR